MDNYSVVYTWGGCTRHMIIQSTSERGAVQQALDLSLTVVSCKRLTMV